jgi:hypothetical protein
LVLSTTILVVSLNLSNDKHTTAKAYSVGFGGGGALYDAVINPRDDNNIFINCDMGSMFVTTDGVNYFNPNLTGVIGNPARFSFSVHNENIVYAAIHNIVHISRDKGRTWDYFFPSADGIAGVTNDGLKYRPIVKTIAVPAGAYSTGIVICVYEHPTDPNTVFALSKGTAYGDDPFGSGGGFYNYQRMTASDNPTIYVTNDRGQNWRVFNNDIVITNNITTWQGEPLNLNMFKGSETHNPRGTAYTADFGERWAYADMIVWNGELHITSNNGYFRFNLQTGAKVYEKQFISASSRFSVHGNTLATYSIVTDTRYAEYNLAVGANTNPIYYRHVVKSVDYGASFRVITNHFAPALSTISPSPFNYADDAHMLFEDIRVSGDRVFVLYEGRAKQGSAGNWVIATGVASTTDDGATWQKHTNGWNNTITTNTFALGVSPSNPDHIIYTGYLNAHETRDGGVTWRSVHQRAVSTENDKTFYTTNGIEPAQQLCLAVDPFDKRHQFAGWIDNPVQETFDGGRSWLRRDDTKSNTYAIAFDPHNRGHIIIGICNGGNSSVERDFQDGKIIKSIDGGATFTDIRTGTFCTALVYDPYKAGVVYASFVGSGIHKSTDGGATWAAFNASIAPQTLTGGASGINLSGLELTHDKKTLIASGKGNCYTLDITTTANTWEPTRGQGGSALVSVKTADGTLYAARPATPTPTREFDEYNGAYIRKTTGGGAFVSVDGGETYTQIFDPRLTVRFIYADTRHKGYLYIHAANRVWVSKKGKNTTPADWRVVDGLFFYAETQTNTRHLMWEDPLDRNRILVSTRCGGTWSLRV